MWVLLTATFPGDWLVWWGFGYFLNLFFKTEKRATFEWQERVKIQTGKANKSVRLSLSHWNCARVSVTHYFKHPLYLWHPSESTSDFVLMLSQYYHLVLNTPRIVSQTIFHLIQLNFVFLQGQICIQRQVLHSITCNSFQTCRWKLHQIVTCVLKGETTESGIWNLHK